MNIKIFKKYKELFFVMSEKKDGSMKVEKNLKSFLNKKKVDINSIVRADLCHKDRIKKVDIKDKGSIVKNVDGLITKEKEVFISVTVADCLPILFYNPKKEEIGIIHAGWKGLYKGIIEKLKINFKDTLFYIGPSISKCHFEVNKDFPLPCFKKNNKYFSDLKKIAKEKIIKMGAVKKNIEISKDCTYCKKNKYSSFRREGVINTMIVIFEMKETKSK